MPTESSATNSGRDPESAPEREAFPAPDDAPEQADFVARGDHENGYEWRACLISAIAALIGAGVLIPESLGFPLDDAWIHLSYAKSLRLGEGLSYNPHDWELGFSSPLWVVALWLWPWVDDPTIPVKLLGILLHAATAWLAAGLVIVLGRERASVEQPIPLASLATLGGVLVATHPVLVHAASSGMEVPLATTTVLAVTWAIVGGYRGPAALLGALATLSRPEAVAYCAAAAGFRLTCDVFTRRRRSDPTRPLLHPRTSAALAATLGAALVLALWLGYGWMRFAQLWPNAQLVKGRGGGIEGLQYVAQEVLPWQPWIIALTGVPLLVRALVFDLRQRRSLLWLAAFAAASTTVAIAVSRPLHPGIGLFESRYFAIVAPLALVVLPFGLLQLRRRWIAIALFPIAAVTGLQLVDVHGIVREQEQDIVALHVDVGRYLAEQLPRDAVVGVEGAGATRFHSPRDMTVVDLVGLNDHEAAARHFDARAKVCHYLDRKLTHLAVPQHWLRQFGRIYRLRLVERFDDPRYTQVSPPRPATVVVAEVLEPHTTWRARCSG